MCQVVRSKFGIKVEDIPQAEQALGIKPRQFERQVEEEWDYAFDMDDKGNIIGVSDCTEQSALEETLWPKLAPFIAPDSFIRIDDDDGNRYRWDFPGEGVATLSEQHDEGWVEVGRWSNGVGGWAG
jgi:hypothetical protein